jgi:glycolate oxidase
MSVCYNENIAVYPRGAGSGTAGGAVPAGKGGIIISTARMNRILSISSERLQAVVEPGVITGVLQAEVEKKGLFYPPDPASLSFCTIGGNVNTCAGGARAIKYGVTRDYVVSLELCLANGNIIKTSSGTAKDVAGYDITRLVVGSEGTLGIVTKIVLKLLPLPEATGTVAGFFRDMKSAVNSVGDVFAKQLLPRCAELLDKNSLACISNTIPATIPEHTEAMILFEVDGPRCHIKEQLSVVKQCCAANNATGIVICDSRKMSEGFWFARRSVSPALKRLGFDRKISEDVCVPRDRLAEMISFLATVEKEHEVSITTFGHAGDGNLHVNIMYNKSDITYDYIVQILNLIMQKAISLGGTISGEHGIGLAKLPFMKLEFPNHTMDIMKHIRKVFDPHGILNPGKKIQ